jgi:hypothetical protein
VKSTIEKTSVRTVHQDTVFYLSGISQIAAGLSADKQLFSRLRHFFQKQYIGTGFRSPSRCHHAACPGAYYNYAIIHHLSIHDYPIVNNYSKSRIWFFYQQATKIVANALPVTHCPELCLERNDTIDSL